MEEQEKTGFIRKLVTILSADVAGYSRLMAEDEVGTLKTFRTHKKVFEDLVKLHRGRIFNTAGDAILAEFPSAVEAVRCATEIQGALRTTNARLPENRKVRFRIGVNLGDVIEQGTDLLGDGVNIAARLQTAAEPGGVCISGSVYDQIASKLSLEVASLGEQTYKNIPQPVRTFSVMRADGATQSLPVSNGSAKAQLVWKPWLPWAAGFSAFAVLATLVLHRPATAPAPAERAPASEAPKKEAPAAEAVKPLPVPETASIAPAPFSAGTAKWVVDADNGPNSNRKTITEAVAGAEPGDVIDIRPGVYKEHLSFTKDVTLRGLPGPDGKIGVRIENEGDDTLAVTNGDVTLENVAVVLRPSAAAKSPSAILVLGGKLSLKHVSAFCGGEHPAVAFSLRDGEAVVENAEFNGRRGIEQLGGKLLCDSCVADGNQEEGAIVFNQERSTAFRSEFRKFRGNRNGFHGFVVMDNSAAVVNGCEVSGNGINGVEVLGSGVATITECDVSNNKENGVVTAGSAKISFLKGKATGNKYSGLAATQTSHLLIRDSELSGNGEFGFATIDSATAQSEENRISANRNGASYRAPASAPAPASKN